ncbi:hypothetical protein NFI96_030096, partial [Prochilodus magdalenae]
LINFLPPHSPQHPPHLPQIRTGQVRRPHSKRRIHKALTAPNISYTHEGVNMAEGMLEGPPHECEEQVERQGKVRRNRGGDREHEIPPEVAVAPWLYLRAIKRKWSEPRWTGPFRVTERTSH